MSKTNRVSCPSPLALFNGSCLGTKPTGLGVVARDLISQLDTGLVHLLDPLQGNRHGSIQIPKSLMPELGVKAHFRRLVWIQTKIPSLLKKSGAEIFLSPVPEAPLFRGVRSVVLAHDLLPLRYPQPTPLLAYHLAYVPLVLHRSQRILCNSKATARELHERLGLPLKKLITIPLGFNPNKLYPLQLTREPFFLVLGRHDPHKNISGILRAIALLRDKETQLWIIGPQDRRYTPSLKKLASELEIDHRCKWIPWVDDSERLKLLNRCQALVIASHWEGFGLPALEAMACNTPVIASNSGALPEVVGDAGLLFDSKDPAALADAMSMVLSDGLLVRSLCSRAKKQLDIYRWDNAARTVEEVLKDLC
ncbi:glycosyltransferase family 1 protein [Prochlorococcus sp. MIT 1300]|uniref:glycosyltransferase family 4 protein n=1 Tax=Prochlorococcus sp. MIT 1300 TaxID=3096218 RepID=UPI002A761AC5|nr:glycosyltransferase family 1 protein [Prochlorococcus sp. MIT 1300]